jgi:hypothetical protein
MVESTCLLGLLVELHRSAEASTGLGAAAWVLGLIGVDLAMDCEVMLVADDEGVSGVDDTAASGTGEWECGLDLGPGLFRDIGPARRAMVLAHRVAFPGVFMWWRWWV